VCTTISDQMFFYGNTIYTTKESLENISTSIDKGSLIDFDSKEKECEFRIPEKRI
jgi:hypothetical protein